MDDATHGYLGYCGVCNLIVMATVDMPSHKRDTAKDCAAVIRSGGTVTRYTIEECKERLLPKENWCQCWRIPQTKRAPQAELFK